MSKKYFNILAPFNGVADVELLKNAGADELYCGYITEKLERKWPSAFCIINHRGEGQSFRNYTIFKAAVKQAQKYNLPVYVTINGFYTLEQYPLLRDLVKKIEHLEGVKGIIIADMGFFLLLKKIGFKKAIHISTLGICFNSQTLKFYQDLGAQRVVLDRQLSTDEINDITAQNGKNLDIEIFVIAGSCRMSINGLCTFVHCIEENSIAPLQHNRTLPFIQRFSTELGARGCNFRYRKLLKNQCGAFNAVSHQKIRHFNLKHDQYLSSGCRMCDLYDLKKYPLKSLKITGRGSNKEANARLVKFVSQSLQFLLRDNITKDQYQKYCQNLFSRIILENKRRCTGADCYFSRLKPL